MKIKNNAIFISILLLLFFSTIYCVFFENLYEAEEDLDNVEYYEIRKMFYEASLENDMYPLNDCNLYIGIDSTQIYDLNELIYDNTLVFRFSGYSCDACINFIVDKLKYHFTDFSSNNRIILMSSELNPKFKQNFYGKSTINFLDNNLGMPIEQKKVPYLFVVNKNKEANMVFIPDTMFPELVDLYLENVKKRFFY